MYQARFNHDMANSKNILLILFPLISFLLSQGTYAEDKPAILDPGALNLDKIIYLEQNWTDEDRQYFYFTDQGSRLLPYDFFLNL